ncbi:hypothetical protein IAQ61_002290 [Plenodomus lingam]|uniref:uncharacterized protein n=1 Tax=Leptosphaeria maculans TaxID=5022 RepID=UPI003327CD45|nr:hypothetical protein IAQ61_002290 [Plenodomus lingam]
MGNNIDAIDLTLTSSPEPEPEPEPERKPAQQQQRSRAQHDLKAEPRSYDLASTQKSQMSDLPRPAANRSIDPQHLRRIVHTSDQHALRKVVLHLCHISPALSGAVARGLAPHSTFAKQVVSDRRHMEATTYQSEDESNDSAYERTKKRLAAHITNPRSASRPLTKCMEIEPTRGEFQIATSPCSVPRVKSESRPILGSSSTDSSKKQLSVPYPPSAAQGASISGSVQSNPEACVNVNRGPTASLASARLFRTPRDIPRRSTCVNCRMWFTSGSDEVCMFHSGHRVRRDGQGIYSCCDAPLTDPGCQFRRHVSSDGADRDGNDRKRPSRSPHPAGMDRVKIRKLPWLN